MLHINNECCVEMPAPIWGVPLGSAEFKGLKDHFQNSRTFQGSSKIPTENQGLFGDFKDQHEFKDFFKDAATLCL